LRKIILYCFAGIFLVGGILGIVKGLFPDMYWLNFRELLGGGSTFEIGETPVYARIYGVAMALLEIISAICLFIQKKNLLLLVAVIIIINMFGCIVAVFIGDLFAVFSLLLRFIPLYFVIKSYRLEKHILD